MQTNASSTGGPGLLARRGGVGGLHGEGAQDGEAAGGSLLSVDVASVPAKTRFHFPPVCGATALLSRAQQADLHRV